MKENTKKGSLLFERISHLFKHYFCYKHIYGGR